MKKPNIIYILADDLGYGELGCYGQEKIKTPNIDKMSREGIKMNRHYSGSTVCSPSRAVLMTGKQIGHASVRANKGKIDPPLPPSDETVAEVLKEAGYVTAAIGKWGLGTQDAHGKGDSIANSQGFDYFFGYNDQVQAHSYYPTYLWENDKKVLFPNNNVLDGDRYSHDVFMEKAFEYIRSHANKENPFFL